MVEPPAAAPSRVAEQDVLLAAKLHVPCAQPGFVPRARLVEALDEGLARGLVLVCAPAGSGKTALLADWARRGQRPVAWLSLDAADNVPARFWRHAAAALDRVSPGIAGRVNPLLGPPAPASFEGAGDGADRRAGRPARCGRDAAGPRRLPADSPGMPG
jgi:ATP/maltotriose-dependent transcriptional regulator MalT